MELSEMYSLLADVSPLFRRVQEVERIEWEGEEVPSTVLMSRVARSVAAEFSTTPEVELRSLFDILERSMTDSNQLVQDVVATGFFEALVVQIRKHNVSSQEVGLCQP